MLWTCVRLRTEHVPQNYLADSDHQSATYPCAGRRMSHYRLTIAPTFPRDLSPLDLHFWVVYLFPSVQNLLREYCISVIVQIDMHDEARLGRLH